ncbi:hypothetical protein X777_16915, partial [Ooceraea biroi]
ARESMVADAPPSRGARPDKSGSMSENDEIWAQHERSRAVVAFATGDSVESR